MVAEGEEVVNVGASVPLVLPDGMAWVIRLILAGHNPSRNRLTESSPRRIFFLFWPAVRIIFPSGGAYVCPVHAEA